MERPKYRAVLRRSTKETTSESSTVARSARGVGGVVPAGTPRTYVKTRCRSDWNMAIAQYHSASATETSIQATT